MELHRRKHERFRPRIPTFVKLRSESEEEMAQLMEISKGGLSICYFVDAEKTRQYSEASIFGSDAEFAVEGIPITNISDTELHDFPFETDMLRRHGIKFEELTPEQASKLDEFITNYTTAV